MNESDYIKILQDRLSKFRFDHSLAVAKSAKELARLYKADKNKAYIAGLLHDIMKDTSEEEALQLFDKYGYKMTAEEESSPQLWHSIAGKIYVQNVLKIKDKDILAAIRYHTTGRAYMSLLEKIVFIADFISDDRDYNGVDRMREKAKISLELAMLEGFQFTMAGLLEEANPIHKDMLEAYNEIVYKYNK